jgi:hypothetical protein
MGVWRTVHADLIGGHSARVKAPMIIAGRGVV